MSQARITRILHPTDFSLSSERALDYSTMLGELTGAELHLLHVVPYPEELRPSEAELRKACEGAERRLRGFGVADAHTAVRVGSPHTEVVRYAGDAKIDLVVMGIVGLSGESGGVLGSTAEKVMRALSVPVLTIKVAEKKARAAGRRCAMCAAPAQDVLCNGCKDRVQSEAVSRKRR
jgi:nucleotide-binding universal stress UspA family protein